MKIINRIKAFFFHSGSPIELELVAAEIKEGKAYLHPKGAEKVTYIVRSDDIAISLNKIRNINSSDIIRLGPKQRDPGEENQPVPQKATPTSPKIPKQESKPTTPLEQQSIPENEFDKYRKRKFIVSLYPGEYEALMSVMKEYGYKRADFVMACVNTATKGTMEKAHKKIVKSHNAIKKEQRDLLAKQQLLHIQDNSIPS